MLAIVLSPEQWSILATALAALVGAYWMHRRAPSEIAKTRSEAGDNAASALSKLFADLGTMRDRLEAIERKEEGTRAQLAETRRELERCQGELTAAAGRVITLRATLPMVTLVEKLRRRTDATRQVLGYCRDGVTLSTAENGGTFVYVSPSFAQALGMTPEEVLGAGWRNLLHPDDVETTSTAASEAWSGSGEITNRYRHKDGSYVRMKWHFTGYDEDHVSLSIVWFERRRDSGITSPAA